MSDRKSHWDTYHDITLNEGSRIAITMRTSTPQRHHSFHHQVVRDIADDLVVTGTTLDGVVEAVEHRSARCIVGVQWHPEDNALEVEDQQRLFNAFVVTCSQSSNFVSRET